MMKLQYLFSVLFLFVVVVVVVVVFNFRIYVTYIAKLCLHIDKDNIIE